nr:hypothetical protein CFP56_40239 [Quercus suber]
MKLSLDDQIIDSQSLTVAILASLLFGETIGFVGGAGLVLGVIGLFLLEIAVEAYSMRRGQNLPMARVRNNGAITKEELAGSARNYGAIPREESARSARNHGVFPREESAGSAKNNGAIPREESVGSARNYGAIPREVLAGSAIMASLFLWFV